MYSFNLKKINIHTGFLHPVNQEVSLLKHGESYSSQVKKPLTDISNGLFPKTNENHLKKKKVNHWPYNHSLLRKDHDNCGIFTFNRSLDKNVPKLEKDKISSERIPKTLTDTGNCSSSKKIAEHLKVENEYGHYNFGSSDRSILVPVFEKNKFCPEKISEIHNDTNNLNGSTNDRLQYDYLPFEANDDHDYDYESSSHFDFTIFDFFIDPEVPLSEKNKYLEEIKNPKKLDKNLNNFEQDKQLSANIWNTETNMKNEFGVIDEESDAESTEISLNPVGFNSFKEESIETIPSDKKRIGKKSKNRQFNSKRNSKSGNKKNTDKKIVLKNLGNFSNLKNLLFGEKIWTLANLNGFKPISWSQGGSKIIINIEELIPYLPQISRSAKYESFLRQMHLYGFRKTINFNTKQVKFDRNIVQYYKKGFNYKSFNGK